MRWSLRGWGGCRDFGEGNRSVALLGPPIGGPVPVEEGAGGFELVYEESVAEQRGRFLSCVALLSGLFSVDAPCIQPTEVGSAVSYGAASSQHTCGLCPGMEDRDSLLFRRLVPDEDGQVEPFGSLESCASWVI